MNGLMEQSNAFGTETVLIRKLRQQSAHYYNRGLECARVRDLSGAIVLLKRSLELNKRNTEARNLLGLIYYETGELVAAFREWIFSKYYQPQGNQADVYLEQANEDAARLHTINTATQRYNQALESVWQGAIDLAIIQLKKVMGAYPNFLRASLLLSLLYLKTNETHLAISVCKKILKIDRSNTMALRYLEEAQRSVTTGIPVNEEEPTNPFDAVQSSPKPIFEQEGISEDKPNVLAFVGLLAGILIGVAVVFFLIVPGREAGVREEYIGIEKEYSEGLNQKIAQIKALETKLETSERKEAELDRQLKEAISKVEYVSVENPQHMELFANLFEAMDAYVLYLSDRQIKASKDQNPDENLCIKTANALIKVDISLTENQQARAYYQKMCDSILPDAASFRYQQGKNEYDKGHFLDAIEALLEAHAYDGNYDRPIYYLGRSYEELGDSLQAIDYYDLLLKTCPESSLSGYASERLILLR